jgi:hypothetical protein
MRLARILVLLLAIGGLALFCGLGRSSVTTDDLETNRRLLKEIHATDLEYYVKLENRYKRFRALSPQEQEKARQLDRQLFEKEPQTQAHLMRVLEEYVAWLTRLPESDRQRILGARSQEERLRIIQELRTSQWVEHLPQVQREQLKQEPNDRDRQKLIETWRREDAARRQEWNDARNSADVLNNRRPNLPFQEMKFRAEVQAFVETKLKPMLNQEELSKLLTAQREAIGNRPFGYYRAVLLFSDRHPVLGLEQRYLSFNDLPEDYKKILNRMPNAQAKIKSKEGKWPDFALEVMDVLHKRADKGKDLKDPKEQLGPCRPEDFPPTVQNFIHNVLDKAILDPVEKERLTKAQSHWPEYPLALHEAARNHNLAIPEITLPGPPKAWDWFRKLPLGMPDNVK